jgi:hypothetical protein
MSIRKALFGFTAVSAVVVGIVGCGGSKTATQQTTASAPVHSTVQTGPTTQAQSQAATRGVKLEKEECEEKTLEAGTPPRDFGIGTADDEAFAVNLALLDARSKLAQQLEVMVTGAIENFNQKYKGKDGATSSYNKSSQLQQGYFEQFLQNTRPICKNTYVKESGEYNVYVAIELDDGMMSKVHEKLSSDGELDIDFKEHQFKEEMKDMRERFLQGKH